MSSMNNAERKAVIKAAYEALVQQKYDPIRQLRGYLLTEDPTYIPDYKGARARIASLDREALLDDLLCLYLSEICAEKKVESD